MFGKSAIKVSLSFCLSALTAIAVRADETKLEFNEFDTRFSVDAGELVRGELGNNQIRFQPLNRNIVTLSQTGSYGEHLDFSAGLMGILWWPLSVAVIAPPEQRTMRVEPRLSEA